VLASSGRPARARTTASPALSLRGSVSLSPGHEPAATRCYRRCNVLRAATPLPARRPVAAALRPGRSPAAPFHPRCQPAYWPCAPLPLALLACRLALRPSSARAASLPAGPALSGTGLPAPPGWARTRSGFPYTVRALAGLCALSLRPRRPAGGLEFHLS
jgi:hypothetical protein